MSKNGAKLLMQMLTSGQQQGAEAARQQSAQDAESQRQQTGLDADSKLRQLLLSQQHTNELDKLGKQHDLENQDIDTRLEKATDYADSHPHMGIALQDKGVSITPKEPNPIAQDRLHARGMADYSKRLEKTNGFNTALKDIETLTNRDGTGGVLTNGNAQLVSTGKVMSRVPSAGVGLAEMLGVPGVPQGSSEERKAMERLQLEYQKATAGMRQTDQLRAQERSAMGMMASGDPALAAKGTRALARLYRNQLASIQSGYDKSVRDDVHATLGGDPASDFANLYNDAPSQAPTQPKAPTVQAPGAGGPLGPSAPPQAAQAPAGGAPKTVVKKQFSPSRNQTKIIYGDGTTEIKDGQQ